MLATAGPSLMWPYAMPMGGTGCGALCCSRPPLTVLAVVGAGLGLPLSEEVLVLGLGATLPALSNTRRLCVVLWLLVGIVSSDLATVAVGAQLRLNAALLRERAPGFGGRLLSSIGQQLSIEGRRDAKRLERQLGRRLESTARTASELLARLTRSFGPPDAPGQASAPPPPLPPLPTALRLQLLRRATCNTRTALAVAGQAGPRLLRKLLAPSAGRVGGVELPYMRTRLSGGGGGGGRGGGLRWRGRRAAPSPSSSFAAGVDNRVGLGQRWPLALLTGLDAPVNVRSYAAGSAAAALALTLPAELALGAALSARPGLIRLIGGAVAVAQLCRFGPLWFAVARAVSLEVAERLRTRA